MRYPFIIKFPRNSNKGYTLTEIMIVVAVIGFLAVIAIPTFTKAREKTYRALCISNLCVIETAKEMWAFATMAPPNAQPTQADLAPYMRKVTTDGSIKMSCPLAEQEGQFALSYFIGDLDTHPECIINSEHVLWGAESQVADQTDQITGKAKNAKKDAKVKKPKEKKDEKK